MVSCGRCASVRPNGKREELEFRLTTGLRHHDKPTHKNVAKPGPAHCRYGTVTVCAGGNNTVSGSMGVPRDFCRSVPSYLPLSTTKRSRVAATSNARWAYGRKGNNTKDHHAFCFSRIHRTSCRTVT